MRTLDDETIDLVTQLQALEIEQSLFVLQADHADKVFALGGLESSSTSLISSSMPVSSPAPATPFDVYSSGRWL